MNLSKNEKAMTIIAGVIMGVIGASLVLFGNPKNMGFCIACFLRDTAGGVGLHRAEVVQYIRPEIIGLIFGSLFAALATKEFSPRGGSAPMTRFVLGFFAMIGALMFLGCPFRMILRIAGGDLNAIVAYRGCIARGPLWPSTGVCCSTALRRVVPPRWQHPRSAAPHVPGSSKSPAALNAIVAFVGFAAASRP